MKVCATCGQSVAEGVGLCPVCGGEVGHGLTHIDDYRIEEIIHEGWATILCRAVKEGTDEPVMLRLFTLNSGVDEAIADRLTRELEELKKLPDEFFIRHREIHRSAQGLWYRVSEWVEAWSWGDLFRSGLLEDRRRVLDLFLAIASTLDLLHQHGHIVPHLILNDLMVLKEDGEKLRVKLDYKLSRFFNPRQDKPAPQLRRLISCHPDIRDGRPLDARSDIWSLGKVFVDILTAEPETCNFVEAVDQLDLPEEVEVLLKTMLAEDPDLRPRSVAEVIEVLVRVTDEDLAAAAQARLARLTAPTRAIGRLQRRFKILAGVVLALTLAGAGAVWFLFGRGGVDQAALLDRYANLYAPSVAYVAVEYWLKEKEATYYLNRIEGTAFLVDEAGFLLTNRHVACPWLEDGAFWTAVARLRSVGRHPRFGYRAFLWFEGQKAYNRTAGLLEEPDLADAYFLENAHRSDGAPRLTIAGVSKPTIARQPSPAASLRDDFAVLKIERVPPGLPPLPLDARLEPAKLPRLTPLAVLGFPLGSRSQESTVNVSITKGAVRRTFGSLIQVDASIYGGNSGGPVIDGRGKVIGLASGVAMDRTPGLPLATPLWNLGLVLPINRAAGFLSEIKAGQVKWNGQIDLEAEAKLGEIMAVARQGRFAEAVIQVDKALSTSLDPRLIQAAAVLHLCADDPAGAARYFGQNLSMDPDSHLARLMLYLIDWLAGRAAQSLHRQPLLALDWRSPSEFLGYLAGLLDGRVTPTEAAQGADNDSERAWLDFLLALGRLKAGDDKAALELLQAALLKADPEGWEYLLARAWSDRTLQRHQAATRNGGEWSTVQAQVEAFHGKLAEAQARKEKAKAEMAALAVQAAGDSTKIKDKRLILARMRELDPTNQDLAVSQVFYAAMDEAWAESLALAQAYLAQPGRASAGRLAVGLLEPELARLLGRQAEALTLLEAYLGRTREPWHHGLAETLLGRRTEEALRQEAGQGPENLLTGHLALGLWAEGLGEKDKALRHYKEALESFLDSWLEYDLVKERLKKLRQTG